MSLYLTVIIDNAKIGTKRSKKNKIVELIFATSMQINDNIKLIRELSGLTQKEFAELIKTNISNLKTYENTDVRPKAYIVLNVSRLAGISASDLETKKLQAEDITIKVPKVEKVEKDASTEKASSGIEADFLEVIKMMVADLRKRSDEKEADLVALRSAVNEIKVVDNKVEGLKTTVHDLQGKVEDAESIIEVLQEFVVRQFVKLRKESREKVLAEMGNVSVEHEKRRRQKDTQPG